MRTADLIEAFPEPPCPLEINLRHASHARKSLFPALARLSDRGRDLPGPVPGMHRLEILNGDADPVEQDRQHASSHIQQQKERPHILRSSDSQNPGAWCSGGLPNHVGGDGTVETTQLEEFNARDRVSNDGRERDQALHVQDVPLVTIDPENGGAMWTTLERSVSPTSGRTEATRYFSAASHMIPATKSANIEALAIGPGIADTMDRTEDKSQRDRAVANGALRFVSQRYSAVANGISGLPTSQEDESPPALARYDDASAEGVGLVGEIALPESAPSNIRRLRVNSSPRLSVARPTHLRASVKKLAHRLIRVVEGSGGLGQSHRRSIKR